VDECKPLNKGGDMKWDVNKMQGAYQGKAYDHNRVEAGRAGGRVPPRRH